MELPFRTISKNLNVLVGTVYNIVQLFKRTGCIDPKSIDHTSTRRLSLYEELVL